MASTATLGLSRYSMGNSCFTLSSSSSSFQVIPFPVPESTVKRSSSRRICCNLRQLRERMETVKNTQKITEAMKLVASAKIRRAQEAAINSRPFAEAIVEVLYDINEQLQWEDVDFPLTVVRPVKKIALVVVTSDSGLCGSFNSAILRKAEARMMELIDLGLDCTIISVGKKGNSYFQRKENKIVDRYVEVGSFPTTKEAQDISNNVISLFVSEGVDKVELLYTKFVSLLKSEPVIHTLLPLSAKGEIRDVNGKSIDVEGDEFFRLTTKEGKLTVEREQWAASKTERAYSRYMQFEQDPAEILDVLMPLYLNSQILKALQESYASEVAARRNAMSSATDNAIELNKKLSMSYNRQRQAKITGEILEIVAGSRALA